jgi:hypothetical protein
MDYWRAHQQCRLGQSDPFHYTHCERHRYTLVTLDADFNDDRRYPFTHGNMPGIIMVRGSSAEVQRVANTLATLLDFLLRLPWPKAFLAETKFVVARDGVIMRGRDGVTRQLKSLRVLAGRTTVRQVRAFFSY